MIGIESSQNLPNDLARKSFAGLITKIGPSGGAPLFAMTSMMKTEIAYQIEHGYYSKTMIFPSVTNGAVAAPAGATTLTVVSTTNILPGMLLRVDTTGENLVVDAVLSTTSLQVTRGVGTTASAIIPISAVMWQIGNAYEQGSLRPQAMAILPVRNTNYTQVFRNTWAVTGSLAATAMIAGNSAAAENKEDCAMLHAADIEKSLLFGEKFLGTRNGQTFSKMEGMVANTSINAAANVTTLGATTTYTQLEAALDPLFNTTTDQRNASERVAFVGGAALRVLNSIGRLNGTYQLLDGATSFGLQFSTFKIARGTVRLIEHPLLNSMGSASVWAKMAIICDLPSFNLAYLVGRQTKHLAFNSPADQVEGSASDNGIDAEGGTLTTECTALFHNPAANGVIYNFTAGAVG